MKRINLFINILLTITLVSLAILFYKDKNKQDSNIIKVSLKGYVKNAGTYFIKDTTTIAELISLAGGYKYNAKRLDNFDIKLTNNAVISIEQKYRIKQ